MSITFGEFDRLSPETLEERILSEAYKKARERYESDRIKIDPQKFTDYSRESMEEDLEFVRRREAEIETSSTPEDVESRKAAVILEEILAEQIELNYWLGITGEDGIETVTRKASRYDDLKNGVDEILELKEQIGTNYLALAIDVTYSGKTLREKMSRIKENIDTGKLSTIKYFESSDERLRGRLSGVAKVVVGIDKKTLVELAKMWIERDNKGLADHPVQAQILEEILLQLKAFKDYAAKTGKTKLIPIFERDIAIFNKIAADPAKVKMIRRYGAVYRNEDNVFKSIVSASQELGLAPATERPYLDSKARSRSAGKYW